MKPQVIGVFLFLLFNGMARAQTIIGMKIDGTINPVSSAYIHEGIRKASDAKAECLLIELNTPGGLLKSTRVIVSDILSSPVPVVIYISPSGAHAGSAGVFITLAAHVAVMAPGTNIGAAHPVGLQGQVDTIMNEKATNDAAAFIRSIAEKRQRNLEWAEEAVRKSLSITDNEALQKKVIDMVAINEQQLLRQLNGREIELPSGNRVLRTTNARIEWLEMSFSEKILDLISDPNVAYILFLLGIYGMMFELYNPGAILPGIVGVIALILAFYAMHTLPLNYAGLALIIFAIILFLLEIKIVSHGLLAIGGIVSLLLGSLMLFRTGSSLEFIRISYSVIITATALSTFFFLFIVGMGLKAQRQKPVTGTEGLVGEIGEALGTLESTGTVRVHGEVWNAESVSGRIYEGEKVRVSAIKNLTLYVEHA